jgi:hypothetical protein
MIKGVSGAISKSENLVDLVGFGHDVFVVRLDLELVQQAEGKGAKIAQGSGPWAWAIGV